MLRDAALNWIDHHFPDPQFRQDFLLHLDKATQLGLNCFLTIGPGLTRNLNPHMIQCFCGELFVFELTEHQARSLKVQPGKVFWGMGLHKDRTRICQNPIVDLSNLEVEGAESMPPDGRIVLDVTYNVGGDCPGPCVFRLDYDLPGIGSTLGWHYFNRPVEGQRRVRCSFDPMTRTNQGKPISGSIAVFLRLCRMPNPKSTKGRDPISNICAAVVSVADGSLAGKRALPW